jgi:glucosamine--fructose-6-phosphate aminotransferase (isomerizing)
MEKIARWLHKKEHVMFLGRGQMHPIAKEGALKLKEISYIDANAYAGGELKHGSLALVDEDMTVVVTAFDDRLFHQMQNSIKEVAARDAKLIIITDEPGKSKLDDISNVEFVLLPEVHDLVRPILATIPMQLLAYYTARFSGKDVDQPRNLAKSVTVE